MSLWAWASAWSACCALWPGVWPLQTLHAAPQAQALAPSAGTKISTGVSETCVGSDTLLQPASNPQLMGMNE